MRNDSSILIVEDEPEICKYLGVILKGQAYCVIEARTSADALSALLRGGISMIILDLGLPDQDGQDFIKSLREWSQIPIIVLSARDQERDKIEALENGADDYLTKPFSPGELLARIKVTLRHLSQSQAIQSAVYDHRGLKIDYAARRVWLDDTEIRLTPIEYNLLKVLCENAGKVLTHSQMLKTVWGRHSTEQTHYLRIHTQHLREKLGDDPLAPRFIITVPGIGYRLKYE